GGVRAEWRRAGGRGRGDGRQERPRDGEVLRPRAAAWSAVLLLLLSPAPPASPAPAEGQPAAVEEDRPLDARTYAQGRDQLRQGKRDEAIQAARTGLHGFPDSPPATPAV